MPLAYGSVATQKQHGSKSLDPEQNRRLRELAQRVLDRCKGSQTEAAKQIGVSQGFLSEFMSEVRGAGPRLFAGLALLFPDEAMAIMTGRATATTAASADERYPNRALAIAANEHRWSHATVKELQSKALKSSTDLTPSEWTQKGDQIQELAGKLDQFIDHGDDPHPPIIIEPKGGPGKKRKR